MIWLQTQKLFPKNVWEPPQLPPIIDDHPSFELFSTEKEIHLNLGWNGEDESIHIYYARVTFPSEELTKAMFKKLERVMMTYLDQEGGVVFIRLVNQFNKVQIETSDIRLFRIFTNIWTRCPSVYCGYIEMKNDYFIRKWLVRSPLLR
jgi:hypothetical protein